ncbi:MAG TPA: sugar transferase [Thermoanaerobaculia bacterium]|nr:sugar transferase [Thermoanaerobaculia bacterium]
MARGFYALIGKRLFDLAVVLPLLLVGWPLLALIAVAIRVTSPGPALFRQERLGKNARVFEALKFRTMTHKHRVPDTVAYSGDQSEITAVGRILRRTKLDELPQILNVLRGDMSLVGPRPQLPIQLQEFDDNARLRLLVRPGLTGMAQTHGNVALSWPERWVYDADYVKRLSFRLDLWLITRTLGVLLHGEERYLVKPPEQQQ